MFTNRLADRLNRGTLTLSLTVCLAGVAWAEPAQLPLLTRDAGGVDPNVLFTIDDSGSMGWQHMPDSIWSNVPSGAGNWTTGFDPAEGNNLSWPKSRYLSTEADDSFAARMRSPDYNAIYYNPAIRYRPWFNSDGSPMADSPPTAALIDPIRPWRGATDLTRLNASVDNNWCLMSDGCLWRTLAYTPATYYVHNGGSFATASSYTRIRIRDFASFTRPASRSDCTPAGSGTVTCTQAQELQNFANWFTYYRLRTYVAVAAASRAFANQGQALRVGYGRINKGSTPVDGVSTPVVERGVRTFTGPDRDAFFSWLHGQSGNGGTPLRYAMDMVGRYFQRNDDRGPWGAHPGLDDDADHMSCRKSYHILMTDGYWNGSAAATGGARANVDGSDGPLIAGPGGQSFRYTPVPPFRDSGGDTLADVAMYYWNRDLRPDLENRVVPDNENPAFWQNLVQFTVGMGVDGTLNSQTDLPLLEAGTLGWPNVTPDTLTTIDDLWHAAVNSRGRYLSAKNPEQFADSLSKILTQIAERESAEGGSAVSSVSLQTNAEKFIPTYKSGRWSGDVVAKRLGSDGTPVSDLWKASEKLPAHAFRNIYIGRGGTLPPAVFKWASLDAALRTQMGPLANDALVEYLRGDRSGEGGAYRARDPHSLLGDFVNSTPLLVGDLINEQYQFLPPGLPGQSSYRQFLQAKAARSKVLFIGGNDGMLHAFDAATGVERFAFIPNAVADRIAFLSQPGYEHKFYVDGPLAEYDAHLGGWRSIVTGSLGAGGRAVFAIDATDPATLGAASVKWEFTDPDLGYTFAAPAVGVSQSGQWVAVFGNGVEGDAGQPSLFVVDLATGQLLKKIVLPASQAGPDNGLGGVRLVKDAHNRIVGAYAGDTLGRLWRFDMRAGSPSGWGVALGGKRLFDAVWLGSAANEQAILGIPEYVVHPGGGQMVVFGTGQLHEDAHLTDVAMQSLYGIYDPVPADQPTTSADGVTLAPGDLVEQTFTGAIGSGESEFYVGTNHPVDFAVRRGWKLDLTLVAGQRMLYSPQLVRGFVLFNTVAPNGGTADPCSGGSSVGINVLLNALNGGQSTRPMIDTNGDGEITESDHLVTAYRTAADGADTVMLGQQGKVVLQRAFGQTSVQIMGREMERTWRQLVTFPE